MPLCPVRTRVSNTYASSSVRVSNLDRAIRIAVALGDKDKLLGIAKLPVPRAETPIIVTVVRSLEVLPEPKPRLNAPPLGIRVPHVVREVERNLSAAMGIPEPLKLKRNFLA